MPPQELDIFYLNLGSATERRAAFVAQYEACHFAPHWTLQRFHAIDAQHELVKTAKGSLSPGNKGCIFSSLECIRQSFDHDRHLFIVDDDIDFCPQTQPMLDLALAQGEEDWDLLLTDTIVPHAFEMPWLMMLRDECRQSGELRIIQLPVANFTFCAGSTIINRRSKRKIHALMQAEEYSVPWDLRMRQHIQQGRVRAKLVFPFLTTVSPRGDQSQITPDSPRQAEHQLYSQFRRLMWIGDQAPAEDAFCRFGTILMPLLRIQMDQRWLRIAA